MRELLRKLWNDDQGALLTSEYLMLGGVVVLGSAGGLAAMRDATVEEMKEMGHSVRAVRQYYTNQLPREMRSLRPVQAIQSASADPACPGCNLVP